MKNKRFYQISGLVVVVAIILLIVGKVTSRNQNAKNINSRITQITKADSRKGHAGSKASSRYKKSKTLNVGRFTKIRLDAYRPDIRISKGKKFKVTISGSDGADLAKIKTAVKNKELRIFDKPEKHYTDGSYYVNLTVPNTGSLSKITGNCLVGDVHLSNLKIPAVNLNLNYGDATITNSQLKFTSRLEDGDLKVKNSKLLGNSVVKLIEGDLNVTNSKLLGNSTIKLIDGDFEATNIPKVSYNLAAGPYSDIKVYGKLHNGHFTKKVKGEPVLKVTNKNGDILIK